jgi:hypothetical protein
MIEINKIIYLKLLISFIFILIININIKAQERWVFYGEDNVLSNVYYYYDSKTTQYTSDYKSINVWVKKDFINNNWYDPNAKEKKYLDYELYKYEIDCKNMKLYIISYYTYYVDSPNEIHPLMVGEVEMVPGSIEETLYFKLCK